MENLTVQKLADILDFSGRFKDRKVTGISTDTRSLKAGQAFIALKGENFDGHEYIPKAIDKNTSCIIAENSVEDFDTEIIKVNDTLEALGKIAAYFRETSDYKLIAITGSVGKTTTRQLVSHVLKQKYKVHQSPKNYNNKIGLPITLLSAPEDTEYLVAELGSNSPGEIEYLTNTAKPDIAVVTNARAAHLEGFGSIQTVINEKVSISEGLKPGGKFIINKQLYGYLDRESTTFSISEPADINPEKIEYQKEGTTFSLNGKRIELPLHGSGNIENALACWAVCKNTQISIDEFASGIKTLPAISMRSEIIEADKITLINDCYNANPTSMENALGIARSLSERENKRLVFICGEMKELGKDSKIYHSKLGKQIADNKVDLLIAIGEDSKYTAENAEKHSKNGMKIKFHKDTKSASNNLTNLLQNYDIVLIKGSRSNRLESLTEKILQNFNQQHKTEIKKN